MNDRPRDPDRTDLTNNPADEPPLSGEAEPAPPAVSDETLDRLANATVYTSEGEKVGNVGRVYLRDETGRPSWVTVKTGFLGLRESLVPMRGIDTSTDELRVPYSKDVIKGAPGVDADDHLSPAEEAELQNYYEQHGWKRHDDTAAAAAVPTSGERRDPEFDERRDAEVRDTEVRDTEVRETGTGAVTETETMHEERRSYGMEEHAPRPDDRPADLSETTVESDRDSVVVGRDERDERDGRDSGDRRDEARADDRGRDPLKRMDAGEALAAGSAGVAGAGVGESEWVDDPDGDRRRDADRIGDGRVDDDRAGHVDADRVDADRVGDDRVTDRDDVRDDRVTDRDDVRDDRDDVRAGATSVEEDDTEVVVAGATERDREFEVAGDDELRLDDPRRENDRQERLDDLEERAARLRDDELTTTPVAADDDSSATRERDEREAQDQEVGWDRPSDEWKDQSVAGTDRDGDRSDHDVAGTDRDDDARDDHSVAGTDRDEHSVAGADRDEHSVAGTDEYQSVSRSESTLEEVRDGGYGVGSAAPLESGLQPLGHPIRAWEDTKSFRSGPAVGVERGPDVWFLDENAAYNAGFHPAD